MPIGMGSWLGWPAWPGPHGLLQAGCEHVSPAAAGKMPVACLAPHSCAPTGSEKTSRGSVASAAECLLEFWWYGRKSMTSFNWNGPLLFCCSLALSFSLYGFYCRWQISQPEMGFMKFQGSTLPRRLGGSFLVIFGLVRCCKLCCKHLGLSKCISAAGAALAAVQTGFAFAGWDCRHLSTMCLLQRCWPYVRKSMPILLVYSPLLTPHWFWLFHMMQGYARQKCFMMFPSPDSVWSFTLHTPKPYQWPRWTSMNLRESMAGSLGKR